MSEPLVFAFTLVDTGAVLFLLVYFSSSISWDTLAEIFRHAVEQILQEPTVEQSFDFLGAGPLDFIRQVITLSDLECDYLNAQQCCSKLNVWVIPKLVAHAVVVLLFLLYGWWILALTNLPMVVWMLYEYVTVPSGNTGVYDPTEIHNRGQLKRHMRDCMISLGWYLITFFIYLYCFLNALLSGDQDVVEEDEDDPFARGRPLSAILTHTNTRS